MKVHFFILLGILTYDWLFSQNLVPNSDFEDIEYPDNNINSFAITSTWYI